MLPKHALCQLSYTERMFLRLNSVQAKRGEPRSGFLCMNASRQLHASHQRPARAGLLMANKNHPQNPSCLFLLPFRQLSGRETTNGAGTGTRTLDIDLGRVALYPLSYARMMWCSPPVQFGGLHHRKLLKTSGASLLGLLCSTITARHRFVFGATKKPGALGIRACC